MWDSGMMGSDVQYLLHHLDVRGWGWVKWTFVILGAITAVGVALRRRNINLHGNLMRLVMLGMIGLFLYGVATRGLFGSVPRSTHSIVFYVPLIIHVSAGGVGLLLGLLAIVHGPAAMRNPAALPAHAWKGRWAARALYVSVLFALPL